MERPYLVLWFALAFFAVLVGWGLYSSLTSEPPAPSTRPASTQPLIERLLEERQRRMATTTTAPTTLPVPADE